MMNPHISAKSISSLAILIFQLSSRSRLIKIFSSLSVSIRETKRKKNRVCYVTVPLLCQTFFVTRFLTFIGDLNNFSFEDSILNTPLNQNLRQLFTTFTASIYSINMKQGLLSCAMMIPHIFSKLIAHGSCSPGQHKIWFAGKWVFSVEEKSTKFQLDTNYDSTKLRWDQVLLLLRAPRTLGGLDLNA